MAISRPHHAVRRSMAKAGFLKRRRKETVTLDGVNVLGPTEAWKLYDSKAQKLLQMSADQFEDAIASGRIKLGTEDRAVLRVSMFRVPRPPK